MAYLKNAPSFDIDMIFGRVITNYYLVDAKTHRESILVTYAGTAAEELLLGYVIFLFKTLLFEKNYTSLL